MWNKSTIVHYDITAYLLVNLCVIQDVLLSGHNIFMMSFGMILLHILSDITFFTFNVTSTCIYWTDIYFLWALQVQYFPAWHICIYRLILGNPWEISVHTSFYVSYDGTYRYCRRYLVVGSLYSSRNKNPRLIESTSTKQGKIKITWDGRQICLIYTWLSNITRNTNWLSPLRIT